MTSNNSSILGQVSVGVLVIGVLTLSFNLYRLSSENKSLKDKISLENSIHKNELSEILKRYDSVSNVLGTNTKRSSLLFKTVIHPEGAVKQPQAVTADLKKTEKVKQKIASTKTKERKKTAKAASNELSSLENDDADLKSKQLKAMNVSVRGVKIIYSDFLETNRSNKIDQIRICYTLAYNENIGRGNQEIFYQIVNPEHTVLSNGLHPNEKYNSDLDCTARGIVFYDNKATDVCAFVDVDKKKLIKGDYEVNIIHQDRIIGTANFQFR